ncbi:MAG TPA: hypothetical protein VL401_02465 [Alphaproteobacteria bacterium]|jgi:7-cyano-7-deazaguanine synthase in queuosine biosynthesis|nr:hypothetical protein [Alphaproteobacteria bacterium]
MKKFYYKSYSWNLKNNDLVIDYNFAADDKYSFSPKLIFKNVTQEVVEKNKLVINNLVFNIGLVELLSYWKAFVTPEIIIECGNLDDYQLAWWKDLLLKGMGQFFYENNIDFTNENFVNFKSVDTFKNNFQKVNVTGDAILVPVGGGKDSSVTLEILNKNFKNVSAFFLNPSVASMKTADISEVNKVVVERYIDKKLFDLNKQGFPNGHTPFTALLSFTSVLAAILNNHKTVVFSNEQSSEEDNTKFLGQSINHQYSKTLDFENKFREYNQKYLSNVDYFSFLRPLYDLQITKIFSRFGKYFSVIRSCNVGQKENIWCGKCPKCLSTFILFHPFLKDKTIEVFGKNLLEDESLKPMLNSLISETEVKPFECVGTREELKFALGIGDKKILTSWNNKNNLPKEYEQLLKKYL